jgi:lysozyme
MPGTMHPTLRKKLAAAGATGASALAIAAILGGWFESSDKRPLKPYYDSVGIPTVCHGVTGPDVTWGKTYTEEECIWLESKHYANAQAGARRQINNFDKLNRWQQAALIDFVYNKGETALSTSTLRKRFNTGDIEGGCNELLRWVKAKDRKTGKLETLGGLVLRADATNELCLYWK